MIEPHRKLAWRVRQEPDRICECWVALAADGRYLVTVTGAGDGCDNAETVLNWNIAQELILRRHAELIEQGWLRDGA